MKFKYTIIGAGVVGLAIARSLSEIYQDDGDILVVEKEKTFGCGISSRNSEVIHSGLYYPHESLKHLLCVRGRKLLYAYCMQHDIPHKKCGKMIITTSPDEEGELDRLYQQANLNQIEHVERLDKKESLRLEPHINVHSSLLLKETGIIDSHALMKSFEYEVKKNKGVLLYNAAVISLRHKGLYEIGLNDGTSFVSDYVINAAGLSATAVAEILDIPIPKLYPCKGVYFSYAGRIQCNHLIYPVPEKNLTGLGVHVTIDLGGRVRFGPDVEYIDTINDYSINEEKKNLFFSHAKKIFPALSLDELHSEMAGIRPKIQGPGDKEVKDFYIREESDKGFPHFINLIGIESPGLTSSMAIAEYVKDSISHLDPLY